MSGEKCPPFPISKKASNRRMVNKLRRKKDVFLRNKYSPEVLHIIVWYYMFDIWI